MDIGYENLLKWFEAYFEDVRQSQGDLDTVPNLKKYFAPDLELTMYTAPSGKISMSRDALLISFVHPGLQEDIVPKHYVIDVGKMVVAVQFEIHFSHKPSGKKWDPIQASAHYHLTCDENRDFKISRIHYWTEALAEDIFAYWSKAREAALSENALNYINSKG